MHITIGTDRETYETTRDVCWIEILPHAEAGQGLMRLHQRDGQPLSIILREVVNLTIWQAKEVFHGDESDHLPGG